MAAYISYEGFARLIKKSLKGRLPDVGDRETQNFVNALRLVVVEASPDKVSSQVIDACLSVAEDIEGRDVIFLMSRSGVPVVRSGELLRKLSYYSGLDQITCEHALRCLSVELGEVMAEARKRGVVEYSSVRVENFGMIIPQHPMSFLVFLWPTEVRG